MDQKKPILNKLPPFEILSDATPSVAFGYY